MGGQKEDFEELSLELSIGGNYGKAPQNLREKTRDFCGGNAKCEEISRCDFSGILDPQRRREIPALKRHDARRKREEKVKKSRGVNNVEDKMMFLEARKFQERVRDREIRETYSFFEEKSRKNEVAGEPGLSLFSENKEGENGCLYPEVQFLEAVNFSDSDNCNGAKSFELCSSAVSDYHSMSQKGGSSSETGSQSSPLGPSQHHQVNGHDSSSQAYHETDRCLGTNTNTNTNTNVSSASEAHSKDTSDKATTGNAGSLSGMPCVSATGDGPNGRTVTGFLYRYDKTEVSIMCVCHGTSFSPAAFVKHAGGVDVAHPLRHITVVTSVLTHSS